MVLYLLAACDLCRTCPDLGDTLNGAELDLDADAVWHVLLVRSVPHALVVCYLCIEHSFDVDKIVGYAPLGYQRTHLSKAGIETESR